MNFAEKIQALYQRFGELEGVSVECQKELIAIGVVNKSARAEVFLQGAQVTAYQRHGEAPILFLSKECEYKEGVPLRGGIPICWPWFGDLDKNSDELKAQFSSSFMASSQVHGFLRNCEWELTDISLPNDSTSILKFECSIDKNNPYAWPFLTHLVYEISVGEQLTVALKVKNTDTKKFIFSAALHTYFLVDNINSTRVMGLEGCDYIDALNGWEKYHQDGAISFSSETDRIYQLKPEMTEFDLFDGSRSLRVTSMGSRSAVVWNPWIKKSKALSQFANDDYKKMLCIETANAGDDIICLEPKQEHVLAVSIS